MDVVPVLKRELQRRFAGDDRLGDTDSERKRQLTAFGGLMVVGPCWLCLDLPGVLEIDCVEVLATSDTRRVDVLTGDVPLMTEKRAEEPPFERPPDKKLRSEKVLVEA